jgi:hypothetical protein
MPIDKGYRYILTVTDIATRLSDAEPLKSRYSDNVVSAFKKIYSRGILKIPSKMVTDQGSEFKKSVLDYFIENGTSLRYAKPGRSRQIAVVEKTNQLLVKHLFHRMQAQELLTGQKSIEWVEDLPNAIKEINSQRERDPPEIKTHITCSGDDCELLNIGTRVRVKLDHPNDYVSGKRLHGGFRTSDIRWDPEIFEIKDLKLLPGQPPMYVVNKSGNPNEIDNTVYYTKAQFQIVPENEEAPPPRIIRGKPEIFVVSKIVDKSVEKGNKVYYRVRWKGYGQNDDTWETRESLIKDIPNLIDDYEKNVK